MSSIRINFIKYLCITLLSTITLCAFTSCTKNEVVRRVTTDPEEEDTTIITPPPPDSMVRASRLEIYYKQSNPANTYRYMDYTFYFDSSNRVAKVGVKNYMELFFDSATCILEYKGKSTKPYMIVAPNKYVSSLERPVRYDTTYFEYDAYKRILKDSCNQLVYKPGSIEFTERRMVRYYYYPAATQTIVNWYTYTPDNAEKLMRQDSLQFAADGQLSELKTTFNSLNITSGNYAHGEGFTFSNFINPLSELNISGTLFSIVGTPVEVEVLGNEFHKAVHNSNILPYYMDFYSPKIPSHFYLGGFDANGWLISSQYDAFDIQIIPSAALENYPAQISVGASTALDDRVVYKYYYDKFPVDQ